MQNKISISIEDVISLITRNLSPDVGIYPGYNNYDYIDYLYLSRKKAYEEIKYILDFFNSFPNIIPIYRAIKAKSLENINKDNLGYYWSWDKKSAINFGLIQTQSNFLISAKTNFDNIDWKSSLEKYFIFSNNMDGEEENELEIIDVDRIFDIKISSLKKSIVENTLNNIIISAGLAIIQDNKILLCHPTGSPWWNTYSIPKGVVENGESLLQAAIRETKEETGIHINIKDIILKQYDIDYKDTEGIIYKRVSYFIAKPKEKIIIDKSKLQKEEIDWCGFIDKKEAEKRILWRLKSILKNIL
jgi:ADP-ribose pyrophosphatase YjhB (NUDIX family)